MSTTVRVLEWDSAFFGLRIGQVVDGVDPDAAVAWARVEGLDCLYLLVPAGDADLVRTAEDGGFRLMDVRVTLEHSLRNTQRDTALPPEDVSPSRRCTAADLPRLKALARVQHYQTRFFRDRRFPPERVGDMYATWLDRAFQNPGGDVFVVDAGMVPAGYITCEISGGAGRIGLAGVAAEHRSLGVGTALVRQALRWFADRGCAACTVVTQGANIPALRLYTSNGFYPVRTELWYHKWFP